MAQQIGTTFKLILKNPANRAGASPNVGSAELLGARVPKYDKPSNN